MVRDRRMVRNLKPRPVPAEKIRKILELAQHAPSAGFSQGWAYLVVTEEGLKKRIGEAQGETGFYAHRRVHKFVSDAPVLVVACVSEKIYRDRYREPDKAREDGKEIEWPIPYWYFDIGCACMLIFLGAVNEGLAVAFTGVLHADKIRGILKIPEYFLPVGVISIGYPARDVKSTSLQRGRRAFHEVVHYEHW